MTSHETLPIKISTSYTTFEIEVYIKYTYTEKIVIDNIFCTSSNIHLNNNTFSWMGK